MYDYSTSFVSELQRSTRQLSCLMRSEVVSLDHPMDMVEFAEGN